MLYLRKSIVYVLGFIALFCTTYPAFPQDADLIIGKNYIFTTAAVYDLSDPTGVNIEVSLWGIVKFPGRYKVPFNTTFLDLISFAGGPVEESNLEEIRIFRTGNDSLLNKNAVIELNYNDLLWSEDVSSSKKMNPVLRSGDIIIIKQESRYTLREDIAFYLPILTSLISIATLIITLSNK